MKRLFIIVAIAAVSCAVACVPPPMASQPDREQTLDQTNNANEGDSTTTPDDNNQPTDGSENNTLIEGDSLPKSYCYIEYPHPSLLPEISLDIRPEYIASGEHTLTSENFMLRIVTTGWHDFSASDSDIDDVMKMQTEWDGEHQELIKKVENLILQHSPNGSKHWGCYTRPQYMYTTLNNMTITCEQVVWGCEPGTDLTDKFYLYHVEPALLLTYPAGELTGMLTGGGEDADWLSLLSQSLVPQGIIVAPKEPFEEQCELPRFWFTFDFGGDIVITTTHAYQYFNKDSSTDDWITI